jgi:long-subunit acyl-CoA synthetase (AMP-forming)
MAGILLPGMKARIVRKNGSQADFGEAGELLLRGPNAVAEKSGSETFTPDGWLRTGDRFVADEQGRFL